MNKSKPNPDPKIYLENKCFSFPTSIFAEDNEGYQWKMFFSRELQMFGLYLRHENSKFVLQDTFHDYSGAKSEVQIMIDRTPGMKEKINNFFN